MSCCLVPAKGKSEVAVIWFRNDLRLEDNLALTAALKEAKHIISIVRITAAGQ
ncbi:MAG: deoxyribodipyrimidine photo-lyase [Deltaproteobacteria bacterium]|nr:deoxyribodipyrimidine photo-lyase [Deltaproteobacteria bacterium]